MIKDEEEVIEESLKEVTIGGAEEEEADKEDGADNTGEDTTSTDKPKKPASRKRPSVRYLALYFHELNRFVSEH